MASNVTSRKTMRQILAIMFSNSLVGIGKPTAAVYAYKPKKFTNGSPAVCVTSAQSGRVRMATPTTSSNILKFEIHVFVVYADALATPPWTELMSEDALDDIEKEISDIVLDNYASDNWATMTFDGETTPEVVIISGVEYQHEVIPIKVQLFGD